MDAKNKTRVTMIFGYVFKIHTPIVGSIVYVNLEKRTWSL